MTSITLIWLGVLIVTALGIYFAIKARAHRATPLFPLFAMLSAGSAISVVSTLALLALW